MLAHTLCPYHTPPFHSLSHTHTHTGLIDKTAVDPKQIDYILGGNVIQEVKTSNIAREAAMAAGLPTNIPSHTVCVCVCACVCSFLE